MSKKNEKIVDLFKNKIPKQEALVRNQGIQYGFYKGTWYGICLGMMLMFLIASRCVSTASACTYLFENFQYVPLLFFIPSLSLSAFIPKSIRGTFNWSLSLPIIFFIASIILILYFI